ncbi:TolC family protein [Roseateles microcysteis]|uniref:TolC family protein n=1 Tax=Roseateles microcysteis TaxID=3119057 RepID=UPI002FE5400A
MALAQGSATASSAAVGFTIKQALDAAWQRSVAAAESQGRYGRARAEQLLAQSWLSAPASVSLSQREGRSGSPSGRRETELGVALPLWNFGARAAGGQATEAESRWARAAEQAALLRLAGQLREAAGAAKLADAELKQVERHVANLQQLAADVERRVKAGDLAPADALAAKAELLSAQSQLRSASQSSSAQHAAWRLLTGLEQLPGAEDVLQAPPEVPEVHPELSLAQSAVDLWQRRVEFAQAQRTEGPELSIGVRQERPGQGVGAQNSVVVGLRMPFGGEAHRQPRIAAALADLETARRQALRTRDQLATELSLAAAHQQASDMQAKLERERASLLAERARLIAKSFEAGETPLPDLLRAVGASADAEAASARQQAGLQLAAARLQQALGLIP